MERKNAASVTGTVGIRFSWRTGRDVLPLGRQHVTGRTGAMFSNSHLGELVNDVGMMIIWPIGVGIHRDCGDRYGNESDDGRFRLG